MGRRTGFTLIELLVVVAIIAVLIAILLPSLGKAREASRTGLCASNLSDIGKAMMTYATQEARFPLVPPPNKASRFGNFPLEMPGIAGAIAPNDPITFSYTNTGALGTAVYPEMGQPMANLWMLMLWDNRISPKIFVCPSDPSSPVPSSLTYQLTSGQVTYLNFGMVGGSRNVLTFSYAFLYPWAGPNNPVPVAGWRPSAKPTVVLGADIGPSKSIPTDDPTGAAGSVLSNSKNHAGRGQNVLFADSHVSFEPRNDVGPAGDNIYTADNGNIYFTKGGVAVSTSVNLNVVPDDGILAPARP
jgi:prepilin-type N-terminal cleavage/methylation domain-containing protein/prepilin-type processing-associated H-X9-DG protein